MRYISSNFKRLAALALMPSTAILGVESIAQKPRPNILLIVADDLGYADLSVQGCPDVKTPHIDLLAHEGIRFTDGYVTCPVCSPSRAALLTGRYQQRFGHEFNSGPAQRAPSNFGLPIEEHTLADQLRNAGYYNGAIGKWHLGYKAMHHPLRRGFDYFYGFTGGSHSYVDANAQGANPILRGMDRIDKIDYTTDIFGREAAQFITAHRDGPWFLYLSFNAVHTPLQAPSRYASLFPEISDSDRRAFAGMLTAMDDSVGLVLRALRESDQDERTLVFFISDNGGPTAKNTSRNQPLRGFKGDVWEGGIRVPWIARWKGTISPGRVSTLPVIHLDIAKTALALAGVQPNSKTSEQLEGISLLPVFLNVDFAAPERTLCWRFGNQRAVRQGTWKLTDTGDGPKLFDLSTDIGEDRNLAEKLPTKLSALERAYNDWNSKNIPALWQDPTGPD